MTSKTMKQKVTIWLARPTAATLASLWRESMNVSIAPRVMMSSVSTNIGTVRNNSSRFSGEAMRSRREMPLGKENAAIETKCGAKIPNNADTATGSALNITIPCIPTACPFIKSQA